MNILLIGASGFIGQQLHAALQTAGHQVTPVSRRHGLDLARLQQPADWLPLLDGMDLAINAAGIIAEQGSQRFSLVHEMAPCALFEACVAANVPRLIQISARGAAPAASSAYHRSKGRADVRLQSLPLDWCILRPGLVYGPGSTSTILFRRLAALPWHFQISGGAQQLQPLHISDLVAAVLQVVAGKGRRSVIELLGPQIWHFSDWLQWLRAAQGLPPARAWPLQARTALTLLRLARHVSPLLQPDNLHMLLASNAANPEATFKLLGRPPLAAEYWLLASPDGQERKDHEL